MFCFGRLSVHGGMAGQRITADDPLLVSLALFAMVTMLNPLRMARNAWWIASLVAIVPTTRAYCRLIPVI